MTKMANIGVLDEPKRSLPLLLNPEPQIIETIAQIESPFGAIQLEYAKNTGITAETPVNAMRNTGFAIQEETQQDATEQSAFHSTKKITRLDLKPAINFNQTGPTTPNQPNPVSDRQIVGEIID